MTNENQIPEQPEQPENKYMTTEIFFEVINKFPRLKNSYVIIANGRGIFLKLDYRRSECYDPDEREYQEEFPNMWNFDISKYSKNDLENLINEYRTYLNFGLIHPDEKNPELLKLKY